ncbi:hypothetical protein KY284_012287 [Solanum tuberosum]|nr:hypothetical protein KY284_012287 [Solanum tuberosum]
MWRMVQIGGGPKLRNHLRWTRIEVKNEGQKIPREVAITKQGYTFRMPIWIEKVTTFEKASGKNMENQISMAETAKTGETLDELCTEVCCMSNEEDG